MKKLIVSIILLAFGLYTLSFWEIGSHGHIQFRPWMFEDWVLSIGIVFCFGLPLFLLIKYLRAHNSKRSS
jgi:hypothetical protein